VVLWVGHVPVQIVLVNQPQDRVHDGLAARCHSTNDVAVAENEHEVCELAQHLCCVDVWTGCGRCVEVRAGRRGAWKVLKKNKNNR
jgi:hypothetical protein